MNGDAVTDYSKFTLLIERQMLVPISQPMDLGLADTTTSLLTLQITDSTTGGVSG